jgi:hypothetical protein
MADLPATPLDLTTLNLCQYAGDLLPRFPDLVASLARLRESPFVVTRMFASRLVVEIAVSEGDMANIARLAVHQARELTYAACHRADKALLRVQAATPSSQTVPEGAVSELIQKPILSCLARQLDEARSLAVPPNWLSGMERLALPPDLHNWLELVSAIDTTTVQDRWMAFVEARRGNQTSTILLYAIGLADEDAAHTGQLLQVHTTLFQALQTGALDKMVTSSITRILTRQWAEIAKQTFRLRFPRLAAPMLEEAVVSELGGLRKIAGVLQAGFFALGATIPDWLDVKLKEAIRTEQT